MFGIGFNELLVIFVVVLIFIRPQDLPKIFRALGKWYAKLKALYQELVAMKDTMVKEVKDAVEFDVTPKTEEKPSAPGPDAAEAPVEKKDPETEVPGAQTKP